MHIRKPSSRSPVNREPSNKSPVNRKPGSKSPVNRKPSKEKGVRFGLNTLDHEELLGVSNGLLTASQLSTGRNVR